MNFRLPLFSLILSILLIFHSKFVAIQNKRGDKWRNAKFTHRNYYSHCRTLILYIFRKEKSIIFFSILLFEIFLAFLNVGWNKINSQLFPCFPEAAYRISSFALSVESCYSLKSVDYPSYKNRYSRMVERKKSSIEIGISCYNAESILYYFKILYFDLYVLSKDFSSNG